MSLPVAQDSFQRMYDTFLVALSLCVERKLACFVKVDERISEDFGAGFFNIAVKGIKRLCKLVTLTIKGVGKVDAVVDVQILYISMGFGRLFACPFYFCEKGQQLLCLRFGDFRVFIICGKESLRLLMRFPDVLFQVFERGDQAFVVLFGHAVGEFGRPSLGLHGKALNPGVVRGVCDVLFSTLCLVALFAEKKSPAEIEASRQQDPFHANSPKNCTCIKKHLRAKVEGAVS